MAVSEVIFVMCSAVVIILLETFSVVILARFSAVSEVIFVMRIAVIVARLEIFSVVILARIVMLTKCTVPVATVQNHRNDSN